MKIVSHIFDFLFPRTCHVCGTRLSSKEEYVCELCLTKLPRTRYHLLKDNAMEQRFMGIVPYERVTACYFYSRSSEVAIILQDLKYRHFQGLARFMGRCMAKELLATGFFSDIDVIMPVPMHWLKKARRGYNQTEEIAKGLSEVIGIPIVGNLRAKRGHRTQTSLSLEMRRKNTKDVFRLDSPEEMEGKHVLILDDVCTTGATLTSAAEVVCTATNDIKISILSLATTF